ncbi:MAG: hypothetical protein IPG25_10760 [Proteobacteria bacterium]|nr:hypothetical protein [Pseudomonadota bacterium]
MADARVILPPPVPAARAPTIVSPAAHSLLRGERPNLTSLSIRWDQPGVIFHPTFDPAPQFFVVCIRPLSGGAPCSWPGDWNAIAGSIPNTVIRSTFPNIALGYRYTFALPSAIPDNKLDVPVVLTVGACSGAKNSACSFGAGVSVQISSLDLDAENIAITVPSATTVSVSGQAINRGTGPIPGTFTGSVTVFKARINAFDQCIRDPSAAGLANDPNIIAMFDNGSGAFVTTLPRGSNGVIDSSHIVALIDVASAAAPVISMVGNPVPGANYVPQVSSARGVVDAEFAVPVSDRPVGFVATFTVDASRQVMEYDETNNVKVECDVVF